MDGQRAASQLRLSAARRRVDAFIKQIDTLAGASFPHPDGKVALKTIREAFVTQRRRLDIPAESRPDLVDRVCLRLADKVSDYTAVLGFILRSTNVRNPFEVHFVLKRLIERVFGHETNLLMSSEWAFVPFTYPMNLKLLPNFVFIGSPAPESGNPLLVPLAGHEVGHSAWRMWDKADKYSGAVAEAVDAELNSNAKALAALVLTQPMGPLDRSVIQDRCSEHAMNQLEEIFCDLFGLHLFGGSYLYAFDYLLGPGGFDRSLDYPSDAQRMHVLTDAAERLGVTVDPLLTERWTAGTPPREQRYMVGIVDAAVATLVARVRDDLLADLDGRGIGIPDETIIAEVRAAFTRGEPHAESAGLGEIVTAGWQRLLDPAGPADHERADMERVLADLVLKTIEVAEYHDRNSTDA